MSETATKTATAALLEKLYKNVKMGSDSILALMPKIEGEHADFKSDLSVQLDGYEGFARRINDLLREKGELPQEESFMTKMSAKMGMTFNTLMDSSVSHLAEMMIQGSTMGISDTIKLLREFENTAAAEGALKIARDIVSFEEENVEKMKAYL